jgi:beta-galactosidase GanA
MRVKGLTFFVMLIFIGFSKRGAAMGNPNSDFFFIDLRSHCNMGFTDEMADDRKGGWTDQGASDLREFPVGIREFGGVSFEVIDPAGNGGRSCIMLRGSAKPYFPAEAAGIKVGKKLKFLYFLHSGAWGGGDAKYVVHFGDGTKAEKELVSGRNIGDWTSPGDLPEARIAWVGQNPSNSQVGVWLMTWENPHPEKIIKTIDFISKGTGGINGLIAITGSGREVAPKGNENTVLAPIRGLAGLDRYYFYRGETITGNFRCKNLSGGRKRGRFVGKIFAGETEKGSWPFGVYNDTLDPEETYSIDLSIPNDLIEGVYRLAVFFEDKERGGHLTEIDSVRFGSMGPKPTSDLTAGNFRKYSEPLHLMIGYVHDDATLRRDFAEMKRKGWDLVCLEWFWNMVDQGEGRANDFTHVKRVIQLAREAGLKYWMYFGFWEYTPKWTAKVVTEDGKTIPCPDMWDKKTREGMIRLYEELAKALKDNPTVIGHTIRLYQHGFSDYSLPYREAWTDYLSKNGFNNKEKVLAIYGNAPEKAVYDETGRIRVPGLAFSKNPGTRELWHLFLKFKEYSLLSMAEELCKAIRKHDPMKPIRLNLAQSQEAECMECPGFSQIGIYQLAEKYGGVVNQECFEYPIHSSKEPPLAEKYGLRITTEGGGVPMPRSTLPILFAHAVEMNPAYVACCHWLVRSEMFEWFKYKPFNKYKLRKNYRRVYDNLTVTSFWKDSWVGDELRGTYFQYHFNYNIGLVRSHYEFEMTNEDLFARGKTTPGSVVLDTNSFYLKDDVCRDIKAFIERGGTFVANHLTGINAYDGGEEFLLLRKYLNVKITTGKSGTVRMKGKYRLTGRNGFQIVPAGGDAILATWESGGPAAIIRKIGKGKLVLVGFPIEADDFQTGVVDQILKGAGVKKTVQCDATEIGVARNDKDEYFITGLNTRAEPLNASIQINQLRPGRTYAIMNLRTQQVEQKKTTSSGTLKFTLPIEASGCNFAELSPLED